MERFTLRFSEGFLEGCSLNFRGRVLRGIFTRVHPPAPTASRDGLCCHRTCLPPCRWSTLTLHPTAATDSRNLCRPCLPTRRRSTLRVDVDLTSYRRHRHARSLSSLSSPSLSLSPPPVNVACRRCILLPPLPCTIFVVVVIPVPVPVPVPAACRRRAST